MLETQTKGPAPVRQYMDSDVPKLASKFDFNGIQCDRLIPTCTTCTGVGVECIPRKFAIGPMTNSGGNLSHAAVPR